ncbi:hypothetical protein [Methanosarcina sp. MTP4]|uniref:hypothetical protein n=1 Tax=Methanosarcina sp. MTP4 TaxID=1434100 RepID=UPI000AA74B4F|nr:hypothetical protein [Methanosarcina sp. MTP4]
MRTGSGKEKGKERGVRGDEKEKDGERGEGRFGFNFHDIGDVQISVDVRITIII